MPSADLIHGRVWARIEYHGPVRLAGHGGTFPGFDAAAFAGPETGESAALLANTNTGLLTGQLRTALLAGTSRPEIMRQR